MTREQIEDDIKRLKNAHAEDEGKYFFLLFLMISADYLMSIVSSNLIKQTY